MVSQPIWAGKPFVVENYTTGTVFVANTEVARQNKAVFERHLVSEWNSDIDATMATIHHDKPYQKIPALGVDVRGYDGIRDFYLGRFASWPGPALKSFDRVAITDHCIYVEGRFDVKSSSDNLSGLAVAAQELSAPCMIVLECRDGLLLGEMVYMDSGGFSAK